MTKDAEKPETTSRNQPVSRRRFLQRAGAVAAVGTAGFVGGRLSAATDPVPVIPAVGTPRFQDKVVLVTGATSGIGRAAAEAFAAEGGRVVFCGRREALGQEVEASIRRAGGEAHYVRADVRLEDEVQAFVETALTEYGRIDVAFNNAGIIIEKPLHEFSTAEWEDVLTTNVRGVYFAMKYQLPPMVSAGRGNILVTSSIAANAARQGASAYGASKAALLGIVRAAAIDYGPLGIRVNAILPGMTDTEMVRRAGGGENLPEPVWNVASSLVADSRVPALQRMASAEEIALFAVDLASDRYPYMTGSAHVIDGGRSAAAP